MMSLCLWEKERAQSPAAAAPAPASLPTLPSAIDTLTHTVTPTSQAQLCAPATVKALLVLPFLPRTLAATRIPRKEAYSFALLTSQERGNARASSPSFPPEERGGWHAGALRRTTPTAPQGHKEEEEQMGNCGTREENAVVAARAQVQQLHLLQHPAKNAVADRKHSRNSLDITDPSTSWTVEDAKNIAIYNNVIAFTLFELETITKSFRADYVLGEGGFGTVYKGYIDENVRVGLKSLPVAVKVLNKDGHQGHREWLTEVNFLGQLRHPNLVKLIGYCCEDDHRLLVYEFMFRGSLENHLFRKTAMPLPWATRMSIALGAAKGLACLHNAQTPVIYRDFKTSNILLDSDYTAKLSDFGLAKAGPEGDETHVSTRVMGTYGYAAPEYVMTGHLTARSDVYSFGVVLLELLTGRKSIDKSRPSREQSLVDWALPKLSDKRRLLQTIDPKLEGQFSVRAAHKACSLAYYCLNQNPKARPLMSDVVETLEPLQGSSGGDGAGQSSGLPDYRARRRLTGNNVHYRAIPNPKCSPSVPACRVR